MSAPLLTSEGSRRVYNGHPTIGDMRALQALADGRTACVRVMSEEECLRMFEHHWDHFGIGERYHDTKAGWLACARANGLVKP